MANAAGMLKESIWRDKDFRALPRTAQATYCELISQKDLDRAGMQPLQVAKWAKGCDEITEADLWVDLKVLEAKRFVFVDEDTDELFIRSYMRHCEVVRYPNILKNALRCAGMVASEKLRHELAKELRRLRKADAERVADAIDPADYAEPQRNQTERLPNPSETVPEGLNGSETLLEPPGYGPGSGSVTLGSSQVGENAEQSRTDETPKPKPDNAPPAPFCPKHMPDGTTDRCGACGGHRRARERWDEQHASEVQDAKDTQRKADTKRQRQCPACDEAGWVLDDDGTPANSARKCTHPNLEAVSHA